MIKMFLCTYVGPERNEADGEFRVTVYMIYTLIKCNKSEERCFGASVSESSDPALMKINITNARRI